MLCGEGNEDGEKKITIGLISKKASSHVQNTFLYVSLLLFCTTTTGNFQKLPSYAIYGGNVERVVSHFLFSLPLIFTLVTVSISHFLTAATKFSCSSYKKCLVCKIDFLCLKKRVWFYC